jgi:hypothetical protein
LQVFMDHLKKLAVSQSAWDFYFVLSFFFFCLFPRVFIYNKMAFSFFN